MVLIMCRAMLITGSSSSNIGTSTARIYQRCATVVFVFGTTIYKYLHTESTLLIDTSKSYSSSQKVAVKIRVVFDKIVLYSFHNTNMGSPEESIVVRNLTFLTPCTG